MYVPFALEASQPKTTEAKELPKKSTPKAKPIVLEKSRFFKTDHFNCVFANHPLSKRNISLHSHTYFELEIITDGNGTMTLNGETHDLCPGFAYILRPTDTHSFSLTSKGNILNLIFSENTFSKNLTDILLCRGGSCVTVLDKDTLCEIQNLFGTAIREQNQSAEFYDGIVTSCAQAVVLMVFRSAGVKNTNKSSQGIFSALRYIKANYRLKLYVEDIAESLNINRRYLSRIFKEKKGITIQQYIIEYKIKKACEFLNHGFKVNEAASMVGYDDTFTFSKIFKKNTGCSPNKYIKNSSEVM